MITTLLFVPRRSAGVCDVSQMQVWVKRKSVFVFYGLVTCWYLQGSQDTLAVLTQYVGINGAVVSRSKRLQMLQYLLLDEVFYSLMRISLFCRV